MKQVNSRAGDTVGLLLHTHLGRDDDEAEQALFEANPGLAAYGPVLPAGVPVIIPTIPSPAPQTLVRPWD